MITVALITTRFVRQGPNKQLLYLIRYINRDHIKPIIITISPEKNSSLIEEFRKEDVEIIQLNLGFFQSLIKGKKILQHLIKTKGINIVHSFTYAERVELLTYNLKNVKKIATIRNSPRQSATSYRGKILGILLYTLKMKIYKNFDILVACSNSIFQLPELKQFKKTCIQNGIDTSMLNKNLINKNKKDLQIKLGIPQNKTIYITVSNGTPLKNIEFLLHFFEKQVDKILIITGNYMSKNDTKSYKNILFTGHINNIYEYYMAADIFISASYWEGLPNAVMESLLFGTPCLLSDIPMHREILKESKNFIGLLFVNNDENDLNNRIKTVETSINNKTSITCSNFIARKFNAKRMAAQYEKLYLSI